MKLGRLPDTPCLEEYKGSAVRVFFHDLCMSVLHVFFLFSESFWSVGSRLHYPLLTIAAGQAYYYRYFGPTEHAGTLARLT
jgi:hypothetical protein